MLWFSSYVIVFEFSWKVKKKKKIGGITYWLTLISWNSLCKSNGETWPSIGKSETFLNLIATLCSGVDSTLTVEQEIAIQVPSGRLFFSFFQIFEFLSTECSTKSNEMWQIVFSINPFQFEGFLEFPCYSKQMLYYNYMAYGTRRINAAFTRALQ